MIALSNLHPPLAYKVKHLRETTRVVPRTTGEADANAARGTTFHKRFKSMNKPRRGDTVDSPFADGYEVKLTAVTPTGVAFKHPTRGMCGMRKDSMTSQQEAIFYPTNNLQTNANRLY